MIRKTLAFSILALASLGAFAQAQTVYTAPASKIGGALAEGIAQSLVRRGFAANDPRIFQTVAAVGSRMAPLASAAGTGATFLSVAARLSPWVLAGVAVYEGVKWYFDADGKVSTLAPGSSASGTSVASYWWSIDLDGKWFRAPEEAAAYWQISAGISTVSQFNTTVQNISGTVVADMSMTVCASTGTCAVRNLRAYAGVPANVSCPTGQYTNNAGGCYSTGLTSSNFNLTAPKVPLQAAYDALTSTAKASELNTELAAEVANRVWRDAASQPGYTGMPWASGYAVQGTDFDPYKSAHPTDWPKTSSLTDVVPTTGTSPIVMPDTNPNQVSSPASAAAVDLGPDPGIPSPTLDEPPDFFKPIKDTMSTWLNWQVPTHVSTCPTWQASPKIGSTTFNIDLSYHCTLAEQYRSLIISASMVVWVLLAAFIVLSA